MFLQSLILEHERSRRERERDMLRVILEALGQRLLG